MTIGEFRSVFSGKIYIENKDGKEISTIEYTDLLNGSEFADTVIRCSVERFEDGVKIYTYLPDIVFEAWKTYSESYYQGYSIGQTVKISVCAMHKEYGCSLTGGNTIEMGTHKGEVYFDLINRWEMVVCEDDENICIIEKIVDDRIWFTNEKLNSRFSLSLDEAKIAIIE